MDFAFSEQQEMLRKMARNFLAIECPKKVVRELEADSKGHSSEMWHKMAELGWMGLPFPEEYGGSGSNFLDLCVLLEEMGRACLPGPYFSTMVLAGLTVLDAGSEEQKKKLLPSIISGQTIATAAFTELQPSDTSSESDKDIVECELRGDRYILNGCKLFVPDANVADRLLCAVYIHGVGKPRNAVTVLLVPLNARGIVCNVMPGLAKDRQCEVVFSDVETPRRNVIGVPGEGLSIINRTLQRAAVAKAVEMVGGMQAVLEMSVEYAKQRVQFDRPIGSFQAIQHHCANMALAVDSARYMAYSAAWKISEGLPCEMEAAAAKAWVSEAYRQVAALGHQVHGAIGFTLDHDMQLYSRRAKASEVMFGDIDYHRGKIAQLLESLPA